MKERVIALMSFKYANCKCDHCGKDFAQTDDIVVCPVCGEPQHRECYKQHGACSHESEHSTGYEWKQPIIEASQTEDVPTKVCTRCGARNRIDAVSCQLCGAPLVFERDDEREPFAAGRNTGDIEFIVDGISSKEIEAYLGVSSRSFMPKFRMLLQSRGGITTWSVPAFFLGPFYFFYRRINKVGILLLALLALIYVPNIIYAFELFKAYYVPEIFGVTIEYSQEIIKIFAPLTNMSYFARMALHVYCCIFANRFFLDQVLVDIKDMRVKFPESDRNQGYLQALAYRGKPAMLRAVLIFLIMAALLYAVIFFMLLPIMPSLPV